MWSIRVRSGGSTLEVGGGKDKLAALDGSTSWKELVNRMRSVCGFSMDEKLTFLSGFPPK